MKPVFTIHDEQTRQGFRRRSTPGGTAGEFSELSFDDSRGSELVYLRAQKDQVTEVEHDQTITVAHDHSLTSQTGGITVTALAGAIDITAATRISLRVAENAITLTPASIGVLADILSVEADLINMQSATLINLQAGGAVNIQAAGAVNVDASEFVAVPPPDLPA